MAEITNQARLPSTILSLGRRRCAVGGYAGWTDGSVASYNTHY